MFPTICRKMKEEKLAKRRFMGLLASDRKTPGRKRKGAAASADVTEADAVNAADVTLKTNNNSTTTELDVIDAAAAAATAASHANNLRRPLSSAGGSSSNSSSNGSSTATPTQPQNHQNSHQNSDNTIDLLLDDDVVLVMADECNSQSSLKQPTEAAAEPTTDPLALPTAAGHVPADQLATADGTAATGGKASAAKERKRRIRIDDDDASPTFNPLGRPTGLGRSRGRGQRGGRGSRGGGRLSFGAPGGVQRTVKGVPIGGTTPMSGETADGDVADAAAAEDASPNAFRLVGSGAAASTADDRRTLDNGGGIVLDDEKMFTSPPEGKVSINGCRI